MDLPTVSAPQMSRWAVCDTAANTIGGSPVVTGIDGELTLGEPAAELGSAEGLLLSYGPTTYLVANGHRMAVDMVHGAVTGPLGITAGMSATPMSRGLFDALPAGGPLVVPLLAGAGDTVCGGLGAGAAHWARWWRAAMWRPVLTASMWCWLTVFRKCRRWWLRFCGRMIRTGWRTRCRFLRISWPAAAATCVGRGLLSASAGADRGCGQPAGDVCGMAVECQRASSEPYGHFWARSAAASEQRQKVVPLVGGAMAASRLTRSGRR